jgi:alginate O-acetyltransferase complex protein AlgI
MVDVVFSSVVFLFLFLPIVILGYFAVPKRFLRLRNLFLLLASLGFYFYGEPALILVMLASISANSLFGWMLGKRRSKGLLAASVVVNLSGLVWFKYLGFVTEALNGLGLGIEPVSVMMPIGVSFFTFQAMSYCLDVYRGAKPCGNPLDVALYISMFPQLIAGPIVRFDMIAGELSDRETSIGKFSQGVHRFVQGLAKKIILSNAMGAVADHVFGKAAGGIPAGVAWIGAIGYTFQIYYDFSGYYDMAVGLGLMFGFTFPENFNYPYISKSITEFWRRWHMSLGTWFRDYLYIPLGGNRRGKIRNIFNLLLVWTLTGLWHGAAWSFVAWGLYFGIILACEKLFLKGRSIPVLSNIYALALIIFGWVIFRSDSLPYAFRYLGDMLSFKNGDGEAFYLISQYKFEWIAAIVFSAPISKLANKLPQGFRELGKPAATFALFALSVVFLLSSTFNPFIYFRF